MKFIFFLLAFFISGSNSFAQITDEAVQLVLTKKFRQFIIKGHTILDTATADFNNDGLRDIALVTSKKKRRCQQSCYDFTKNGNWIYYCRQVQ